LTKQNSELKRDLEQGKSVLSSSRFDTENELAKLSIENENLKRQMKDASGKLLNVKYDNKEVEDMRKRLVQLENEKEKLDSELVRAKMGWASADNERDEVKSKLKAKEEGTKGQQERMEIMEIEIFKLRSRMAELMNAVMEFGEMELLDQIESIITQDSNN
jgi:chromosome segregation ATPase